MSGNDHPVEINYDSVETETESAILFNVEEGDPSQMIPPLQHWIPKSQIMEQTKDYFTIPQWLAETKNLV